eukprot:7639717-Alexandrium_andersonii.AAC.1
MPCAHRRNSKLRHPGPHLPGPMHARPRRGWNPGNASLTRSDPAAPTPPPCRKPAESRTIDHPHCG